MVLSLPRYFFRKVLVTAAMHVGNPFPHFLVSLSLKSESHADLHGRWNPISTVPSHSLGFNRRTTVPCPSSAVLTVCKTKGSLTVRNRPCGGRLPSCVGHVMHCRGSLYRSANANSDTECRMYSQRHQLLDTGSPVCRQILRHGHLQRNADGRAVRPILHQSSINDNMPLRLLIYAAHVFEKLIENDTVYMRKLLGISKPWSNQRGFSSATIERTPQIISGSSSSITSTTSYHVNA